MFPIGNTEPEVWVQFTLGKESKIPDQVIFAVGLLKYKAIPEGSDEVRLIVGVLLKVRIYGTEYQLLSFPPPPSFPLPPSLPSPPPSPSA